LQPARLPLQNSTKAFSTKPPQFYLEAVSFWLKRLRFFLALCESELAFLSHPATSPFRDSKMPF
jgi:hypothetical protein